MRIILSIVDPIDKTSTIATNTFKLQLNASDALPTATESYRSDLMSANHASFDLVSTESLESYICKPTSMLLSPHCSSYLQTCKHMREMLEDPSLWRVILSDLLDVILLPRLRSCLMAIPLNELRKTTSRIVRLDHIWSLENVYPVNVARHQLAIHYPTQYTYSSLYLEGSY